MTRPLICLSFGVCLLTSCMTTTDQVFTGTITADGKTLALHRQPAPCGRELSDLQNTERTYSLPNLDYGLVLRTPRIPAASRNAPVKFSVPSNHFGVFLVHENHTNETPLSGSILFYNPWGSDFRIDVASANGREGISGRLKTIKHHEFHPILALSMITGIGVGAKMPEYQPTKPATGQGQTTETNAPVLPK